MIELKNLRDTLADCLEYVFNEVNSDLEYCVFDSSTGEVVFAEYGALCFTSFDMSQWDYTDEEWEEIDWDILSCELIGSFDDEDKKFYFSTYLRDV